MAGDGRRRAEGRAATPRADKIRVGVSSCLLGIAVRYDAGHKHDCYVSDVLGRHFELVPVCPEVEAGMGVPREPVRLVRVVANAKSRDAGDLRMLGVETAHDHTGVMKRFAKKRVAALSAARISGYILKKGSPSCGIERVKTYTTAGKPAPPDRGLFAAALREAMPLLPVVEEGRLGDAVVRERFIERVFAYARVTEVFAGRWSLGDLVAFHAKERMQIAAHSPAAEKELGCIVAGARGKPRAQTAASYREGFLRVLAKPAPRKRPVNRRA